MAQHLGVRVRVPNHAARNRGEKQAEHAVDKFGCVVRVPHPRPGQADDARNAVRFHRRDDVPGSGGLEVFGRTLRLTEYAQHGVAARDGLGYVGGVQRVTTDDQQIFLRHVEFGGVSGERPHLMTPLQSRRHERFAGTTRRAENGQLHPNISAWPRTHASRVVVSTGIFSSAAARSTFVENRSGCS